MDQVLPELLCIVSTKVLTGLQKRRRTIRHRSPHIHKHLWIAQPGLLITVKAICPTLVTVQQPPLTHRTPQQVVHTFYCRCPARRQGRNRKCALMASTNQQGQDDQKQGRLPVITSCYLIAQVIYSSHFPMKRTSCPRKSKP